MDSFIHKHKENITGILSGFDRLVLRGSIRSLSYVDGMKGYLSASRVLLKDFASHMQNITGKIKAAAISIADKYEKTPIYLESPKISKENKAKEIMRKDGTEDGLVCVFKAVEPCMSYVVSPDRKSKKLVLRSIPRKCTHIYHYTIDPVFGFMNARIQTWFPFQIQICINGREWLARQMNKDGIDFIRRDNCFTHVDKVYLAQRRLEKQLQIDWPAALNRLARQLNPLHERIFKGLNLEYYWSVHQSEWATDIMFKDTASLDEIYAALIRHGMTTFQSPDIMRFFGRRLPASGNIHGRFDGEVTSDMKIRHEGVRIKHRLGRNSIKAYNKEGSILRIETTINDAAGFKVYRPKQGGDGRCREWLPMRRGVADLYRRTEVSQAANDRYIEAIAETDSTTPIRKLVAGILRHTKLNGYRVRAINPWSTDDASLMEIVSRGEFTINGFRNRDVRALFFQNDAESHHERRRQSAAISRKLRILRAHGLIRKVPKTHRYQVTSKGRMIISALIAAHNASAEKLAAMAA